MEAQLGSGGWQRSSALGRGSGRQRMEAQLGSGGWHEGAHAAGVCGGMGCPAQPT